MRMTIGAARKAISKLLIEIWLTVDSFDQINSYTFGYIEALNEALKSIGGIPPKVAKCLDPECRNIIVQRGSGRTRKYCSDICRARAYRLRKTTSKGL